MFLHVEQHLNIRNEPSVLIDALLVTYVVLLLHNQRLAVERREKVRYLPHVGATEPAYLLQRSAN